MDDFEESDEMDDGDESEDFDENDEVSYPFKRTGHISCKYENCIIVWGGYVYNRILTRFHSTTKLWIYDPFIDKWSCKLTSLDNAPIGRSGAAGLICKDCLFIFGGYNRLKYKNTNEIFCLNLKDLQWTKHKPTGDKPLPCDKMVSWLHNDKLFYFGGFGHYFGTQSKQLFDFTYDETLPGKGWNNQLVEYDVNSNSWIWPKCKGRPPVPRAAHACVKVNNKVYIFGGRHQNSRLNDLHCLDLDSMTWSGKIYTQGSVPTGRSWHSLTRVSDNHVVLYGGLSNQREALSDCWILDVKDLHWTKINLTFEKARVWHTACENDPGEVIIFGGCTGNILNPTPVPEADELITLWFTPKSLLRSCLDSIVNNKHLLEPYWFMLPTPLSKILKLKSIYNQSSKEKDEFCEMET